jgi:CRISPR/Cas system CSM-associated protein Csm3 (group 7 of RAMP superfamily)
MPLSTIELSGLTVQVVGPMHIGAGFARGLVNRTVMRGRDGLVYVPGSTLKGKNRDACEALARLHEISDCEAPYPQRMAEAEHRQKCLVCRIFGAPAQPSTLRWHSAHLTKEWQDALRPTTESRSVLGQTTTRTQVQLSRKRGLAAEARLFTTEFAAEGLRFEATPALTGRMQLMEMAAADEPEVYYELVLLLAGLKLIAGLGGSLSRGAGQCEITMPPTIRVNGQDVSVERQLAHVEELALYWDEAEARP